RLRSRLSPPLFPYTTLFRSAHRRDPLDQILRHRRFALDATDSRCCAPLPYPFQPPRLFRREQFMPVIHRTHVRISRIGASLPSRDRKSTRLNSSHLGISYAV